MSGSYSILVQGGYICISSKMAALRGLYAMRHPQIVSFNGNRSRSRPY
jgi:hypothetical protein